MQKKSDFVTAPWGALLTRILNIIDALAEWTPDIVEKLYVDTNGQVDKLFPDAGDILAAYLVEGRIYRNSPQGWYILTAKQFKCGNLALSPYFWARCIFHSDIPPVPDTAIPWHGPADPWLMREKLTDKPMWLRLCSTEEFGCSYYNLSDWIKTKRAMYDSDITSLGMALSKRNTTPRIVSVCSRQKSRGKDYLKESSTPSRTKRLGQRTAGPGKRKRPKSSVSGEYIIAESSESSASSDSECVDSLKCSLFQQFESTRFGEEDRRKVFRLTTGKVSSDMQSASTSASSSVCITPSNGRVARGKSHTNLSQPSLIKGVSRLSKDPKWIQLRTETCSTFHNVILSRTKRSSGLDWTTTLSQRIEEEAVFSKCIMNEDRYIGLSRAVVGILKQFDCLIDSLETLIPLDEELRGSIQSDGLTMDAQTSLELFHGTACSVLEY